MANWKLHICLILFGFLLISPNPSAIDSSEIVIETTEFENETDSSELFGFGQNENISEIQLDFPINLTESPGIESGNIIQPDAVSDKLDSTIISGFATWYNPKWGIAACGSKHRDSEMLVAIGWPYFTNPNPNKDPMCGEELMVINPRTKLKIKVEIRDKCESCGRKKIDLSPAAFQALGEDLNKGRVRIEWSFVQHVKSNQNYSKNGINSQE